MVKLSAFFFLINWVKISLMESMKITLKVASVDYIWQILVKSSSVLYIWWTRVMIIIKMATTFSKHWFYVFALLGHTRVLLHQSGSFGQGTGWGDIQQSTGQGRGHRIPAVHTVLHHGPSLTNLEGRTVEKKGIDNKCLIDNIKYLSNYLSELIFTK